MSRKPISKRVRFEVFKRDEFTCQYCGATPPEVVLQVDHIEPVAKGGRNDFANLITACTDCNGGKGDRHLDDLGDLAEIVSAALDDWKIKRDTDAAFREFREIDEWLAAQGDTL